MMKRREEVVVTSFLTNAYRDERLIEEMKDAYVKNKSFLLILEDSTSDSEFGYRAKIRPLSYFHENDALAYEVYPENNIGSSVLLEAISVVSYSFASELLTEIEDECEIVEKIDLGSFLELSEIDIICIEELVEKMDALDLDYPDIKSLVKENDDSESLGGQIIKCLQELIIEAFVNDLSDFFYNYIDGSKDWNFIYELNSSVVDFDVTLYIKTGSDEEAVSYDIDSETIDEYIENGIFEAFRSYEGKENPLFLLK